MADRPGWRVSSVFLGVLIIGALAGGVVRPAGAQVTAVKGEAFGYFASVSLFGGPANTRGPEPIVTLASDASNSPQQATLPQGLVQFGPAILFSTDQITVNTMGSLGAGGTAASSTSLTNINRSLQEVFTAASATSSCSASESAVSGSTTINGGVLQTSEGDPNVDGDEVFVNIPTNPTPGLSIHGVIEAVGDNFDYVFNEQITNPDGSLTVYAGHLKLNGPTAVGDLFWGKSECGVTAAPPTTTSSIPGSTSSTTPGSTSSTTPGSSTSTTPTSSTSSTSSTSTSSTSSTTRPTTSTSTTTTSTTRPPSTTTTTTASTTTTAAPPLTEIAGGAYGYFVSISLFGGPANSRGPTPQVTLPAGGSASPVTASEPSALAQFGPATIFSSDRLEVSTQGTSASGSVTSSATAQNVNKSGQEVFTASTASSTCTASGSGVSGTTTLAGASVIISEGSNLDSDADDVIVQIPNDPAPNTSYNGTIETVGDNFRLVVNEQQPTNGAITVNAVHMYLLGPTAVGELVIAQSRCGLTASGGGGGGGDGGGTGGGGTGTGGTGGTGGRTGALAFTGNEAVLFSLVAIDLMLVGVMILRWAARRRYGRVADDALSWPWTRLP